MHRGKITVGVVAISLASSIPWLTVYAQNAGSAAPVASAPPAVPAPPAVSAPPAVPAPPAASPPPAVPAPPAVSPPRAVSAPPATISPYSYGYRASDEETPISPYFSGYRYVRPPVRTEIINPPAPVYPSPPVTRSYAPPPIASGSFGSATPGFLGSAN